MARKVSNKEFISMCIKTHGNKYDYSKTVYKGRRKEIIIGCPQHGDFIQLAGNHVRKTGCPECAKHLVAEKIRWSKLKDRNSLPLMKLPKNVIAIPLPKGQFTIIDSEDYHKVCDDLWFIDAKGYVRTKHEKGGLSPLLHRRILGTTNVRIHIDHRNHDLLDNRKCNIRECSVVENNRNRYKSKNKSSKHKGVSWHKRIKKWQSYIKYNEKQIHLGFFDDEIEATKTYNEAAKKYFKEFSYLNKI